MKFEIVELDEFLGRKSSVYSVWIEDINKTLFDQFVEEAVFALNFKAFLNSKICTPDNNHSDTQNSICK